MLRHMRTTMIINDELYRQVKALARAQDRTVTSFVEDALRARLAHEEAPLGVVDVYLAPPTGSAGASPLADLSDPKAVSRLLAEQDSERFADVSTRNAP